VSNENLTYTATITPPTCAFYTDVLLKSGVPHSAIIPEDKSRFTKENATLSRKVADENGLAVQKGNRSLQVISRPPKPDVLSIRFPICRDTGCCLFMCMTSAEKTGHTHEYGIGRVLGELARCGNQFVEDFKNA